MTDATRLAELITLGLEAVSLKMEIVVDDGILAIRDLVVECDDDTIICRSVLVEGGDPIFSMPAVAFESAAAAIAMRMAERVVTRAIGIACADDA